MSLNYWIGNFYRVSVRENHNTQSDEHWGNAREHGNTEALNQHGC